MVKLGINEKIVVLTRQKHEKGSLLTTRRICSICKKKRYISFLRFAECGNCLVCRNSSHCRSKHQFALFII